MKTTTQLRAEIYNSLISDPDLSSLISTRLYWVSRPTTNNTFPLIIYKYFDTIGEYAFDPTGVKRSAEVVTFQLDVYTSPQNVSSMDAITERLKVVMNGLGYRNINSPIEFLEADINAIVRPTRWERYNV